MKNGASKLLQSLDFGPIGVTNHRLFRMFKSPSIVTMESFANCWKQLTTPKDFWSSGPVLDILALSENTKGDFFLNVIEVSLYIQSCLWPIHWEWQSLQNQF